MAATTKKPARLTAKQQKTVDKVRDVLEAYPLGIALDDLIKEANLTAWTTQQALSLVGASMRYDGMWQLPASESSSDPTKGDEDQSPAPVQDAPVNMQDNAENMQDDAKIMQKDGNSAEDDSLNTIAPHVSSPDNDGATLINTPAPLVNPTAEIVNPSAIDTVADQQDIIEVGQIIASSGDLHPEFAQLPDHKNYGSTSYSAPVKQKTYLVIETCYLSIDRERSHCAPALAKETWFDDEGCELCDEDAAVLDRAVEKYSDEVTFMLVTYKRVFTSGRTELLHGVFYNNEEAQWRVQELLSIKNDADIKIMVIQQ